MKKSINRQATKLLATNIHNHFKSKGYEFQKPGPHLSTLLQVTDRNAKMLEIKKGISEACGNSKLLTQALAETEIKRLGKALVNQFQAIDRDTHDFIIECFYSQNNHLRKKNPKLLNLIQCLMRFVNELDENKMQNNNDPDNDYQAVKREREIKRKNGTLKKRTVKKNPR